MRASILRRTLLSATLIGLAACGSGKVPVTSCECTPSFSFYDTAWGMQVLGYDMNRDQHIDEFLQVTATPGTEITAVYLSNLPTKQWKHHFAPGLLPEDRCWATEYGRAMTADEQKRYDLMLQEAQTE